VSVERLCERSDVAEPLAERLWERSDVVVPLAERLCDFALTASSAAQPYSWRRIARGAFFVYSVMTAPAQVKPLPNAANSTFDPLPQRPSRHASLSPSGMVAAVVLP